MCLELYKLAQGGLPLDAYKNAFVNLALPFWTFSEPLPPKKFKPRLSPEGDEILTYPAAGWTEWDRVDVHMDGTIADLCAELKVTFPPPAEPLFSQISNRSSPQVRGIAVQSIASGVGLMYTSFMPAHKPRLAQKYVADHGFHLACN